MNTLEIFTYIATGVGLGFAIIAVLRYGRNQRAYRKFRSGDIPTHNIKLGAIPPKVYADRHLAAANTMLNAVRHLRSTAANTNSPFVLLLKDNQRNEMIIATEGDKYQLIKCISDATDKDAQAEELMQIITKYYQAKFSNNP